MGRFINADALVATGQGILGNNMFAYCRNNPVCRRDVSGATDEKCYEGASDPLGDDEDLTGGKMGNGSGGNDGVSGKTSKNARGVGGKGWRGDQTWKQNVKIVAGGGDVRGLNGGTPTVGEARALITEARGSYVSYHTAHPVGGISTHTYNHIHYLTERGIRSTIEVQEHR